jgi:hypothetical protein
MNRSRTHLVALFTPLLAGLFLPVKLAVLLFQLQVGRVRAARQAGDRGAISIELAIAVVALVLIAGTVVVALNALRTKATDRVTSVSVTPS